MTREEAVRESSVERFLECEAKRAEARAAASKEGKSEDDARKIAHEAAKKHWNAWAEDLLSEREALESAWAQEKDSFGRLSPKNAETRSWMEKAKVNFSRCLFLLEGVEGTQEAPGDDKDDVEAASLPVKSIAIEGRVADFRGFVFPGNASFSRATFSGDASFDSATFSGNAWFESATFKGYASFNSATFSASLWFYSATFSAIAWFYSATFSGDAWFGGATFSGNAWFERATFLDNALFEKATFSSAAGFDSATFSGNAWFESATFSRDARFGNATFSGGIAWIRNVTFSGDARFEKATFSSDAWFDSATFSGKALFDSATFSGITRFDRATFSGIAQFYSANFSGNVWFGGATFSGNAWFYSATFSSDVSFGRATFSGDAVFASATFTKSTSFRNARFGSEEKKTDADFTAIKVERAFDLTETHFSKMPDFCQADFKQAPDLDDVDFPLPPAEPLTIGDKDLIPKYRTIRRMAMQSADYDREQRAFKGEMRSRRWGIDKFWHPEGFFGWCYDWAADCGRSIIRPFAIWLLSIFVFAVLYLPAGNNALDTCVSGKDSIFVKSLYISGRNALVLSTGGKDDRITQAYRCLFGPDNVKLPPDIPDAVSFVEAFVQVPLSAVLIFLFLLAVKNRFKIK